jgi:hypothetical protein
MHICQTKENDHPYSYALYEYILRKAYKKSVLDLIILFFIMNLITN